MGLSAEEKEKLIKALEEDREFRYTIMGLLGFEEILNRITRLEERFAELEKRFVEVAERQQRLEERFAKLEERFARIEEEMRETRRVLVVIAHRFGVISEAGLREALKYVVQEVLGVATVERKVVRDDDGVVYGHPAVVEIDVVVRDSEHVLVEIKSRVSRGDVAELHRIGVVYERVYGVKPRLLVVGGYVDPDAITTATRLGVEVKPAVRLD